MNLLRYTLNADLGADEITATDAKRVATRLGAAGALDLPYDPEVPTAMLVEGKVRARPL